MNQFRQIVEGSDVLRVSERIFAQATRCGSNGVFLAPSDYYRQLAELIEEVALRRDATTRCDLIILLQKTELLAVKRHLDSN